GPWTGSVVCPCHPCVRFPGSRWQCTISGSCTLNGHNQHVSMRSSSTAVIQFSILMDVALGASRPVCRPLSGSCDALCMSPLFPPSPPPCHQSGEGCALARGVGGRPQRIGATPPAACVTSPLTSRTCRH
ncbi:hypothetical protein AB205_0157720, partial [Aquarana catesbeiana]